MEEKLEEFLIHHPFTCKLRLDEEERHRLASIIEEDYLTSFISAVIHESEKIMAIDPSLPRQEILKLAAAMLVKNLNAQAASIRLFDPDSHRMLSSATCNMDDYHRRSTIPFKDSIAGDVVRGNRSIPVPSILKNPLYRSKEIVKKKGLHSLLAVPLRIPQFIDDTWDLLGSIQIYYREDNRRFKDLEIIHAELLARRVSFVLAKKKIIDLHRLNRRKETISDKIFIKLSNREGIKLKDLFMLLIPELREVLAVRNCSLFTLSRDQQHIHLEASYPTDITYHEPGYTFTLANHPYFLTTIKGGAYGDYPHERIHPTYLLIKDPLHSKLTSPGLIKFVKKHRINSILLVPLKVNDTVRHLLTFFGSDRKQSFSDDEIELLVFLGKEVMKASRLEFLGDMLHDFKNPAVAVAGLAARARKLLDEEDLNSVRDKLTTLLEVVASESERLQDVALTITGEGHESLIDLGKIATERYHLNEAVIQESGHAGIITKPVETEEEMLVLCSRAGLIRVMDNLLNNATKAIPAQGGVLSLRCRREREMVRLELQNSGAMDQAMIENIKRGEVKGRGFNIIHRFIQANHGALDIKVKNHSTVVIIHLPLQKRTPS